MKLYNSMTNKIETFKTIKENEVSMYVCGPTVYNYIHIGNARPIIVFDTLRNVLEYQGYKVTHISNYTDVDDKIIKRAIEENVSESEITQKYIKAYEDDRKRLHAKMPTYTPKVTETMDDIINFIAELVAKDYAYEAEGDVYFRVNKIKEYGKLANQNLEDLLVGARIEENSIKENPLDFTLWKKTDLGIKWDSPWSKGRPGWHTECVVMINKIVENGHIDIHGGGMDLKFPHHENEIAQSLALNNHKIANYWVHNGMLNIDGEKMSKSLGNVLWTKDFVEKIGANTFRWMMLATHYRAPLNINEQAVEVAKTELDKVLNPLKQYQIKLALNDVEVKEGIDQEMMSKFIGHLEDDLNTPNAFSTLFESVKTFNQLLRTREIDFEKANIVYNTINKMLEILGIEAKKLELSLEDKQLFKQWDQFKKAKEFEKADEIRSLLIEKGLI